MNRHLPIRALFPCSLGQPARPPQDRHRDPPRCPDRQVPVHRPRHGHRVRRDLRDRDNCTIYHGVTLGGTGKDTGKRHPTLGNNVLIGAGTKVLGPVFIGDNARVDAGSVVLRNLPANCTAVGVPAEVVRINNKAIVPSDDLDQQDLPDVTASASPSWTAASAPSSAPPRATFPLPPSSWPNAGRIDPYFKMQKAGTSEFPQTYLLLLFPLIYSLWCTALLLFEPQPAPAG